MGYAGADGGVYCGELDLGGVGGVSIVGIVCLRVVISDLYLNAIIADMAGVGNEEESVDSRKGIL